MGGFRLQLRWSLRDLRARWVLVAAIALIVALGTGLASGLGSMRSWRVASNDASYALLDSHDLRITLPEGSRVAAAALIAAIRSIPDATSITGLQQRLVASVQVDASLPGRTRIVPGRIVGIPVSGAPSQIDRLHLWEGRAFGPADSRADVAVLERTFAEANGLPATGRVLIGATTPLRYVGTGVTPDYFVVSRPGASISAADGYAVLFVPLATAQKIAGAPGRVNEVAITVRPGTDLASVEREITSALAVRLGGLGATFTRRAQEAPHRLLYADAKNDQRLYDVFAFLVIAAAALATFNLVGRIVDSQRREIGIGMALGLDGRYLAIRPLLLGAEIALLGALMGIALGLIFNAVFRSLLGSLLPMPVLVTPFQPAVFARGALIGFLLPFVAAVYPVWRAVRVAPVDAIQVGARAARGAGWASAVRRLPAPGGSLARMPLRNTLRAPRRTLLTALAVGVVIAVVVAFAGMIDTFRQSISQGRSAIEGGNPARMVVELDGFRPEAAAAAAVRRAGVTSAVVPAIRVGAEMSSRSASTPIILELVNPTSDVWRPRIVDGRFPTGTQGLVISREAARDLGVGVGDDVRVTHPRRLGGAIGLTQSRMRVAAIHPNPFRFYTYLDVSQASVLGLSGLANTLSVLPGTGVSQQQVTRRLSSLPGVTSIEPANAALKSVDDRIDDFVGILLFAEGIVLSLAVLIAANAAAINAEERRREHATMMAFGLPVRAPILIAMGEGLVVGMIATLTGLGLGLAILQWFVRSLVQDTLPEMGAVVSLSGASLATVVVAGLAATTLAPLLTVRRLRHINIPTSLGVVE